LSHTSPLPRHDALPICQIYIAKLEDPGGLTFGTPTPLSTESCSTPPCSHDSADIAAAGTDVHVTWRTANVGADAMPSPTSPTHRSEEHTSELQSPDHLV